MEEVSVVCANEGSACKVVLMASAHYGLADPSLLEPFHTNPLRMSEEEGCRSFALKPYTQSAQDTGTLME
jgi:hypothetical protein